MKTLERRAIPSAGVGVARGRWRSTALVVLLAAVVLLPLLGHKALAEWDEGIYAEVSREMLRTGWVVPHWNGEVWFEKPPLMLWVTAAFFKVFGVNELWARMGSALAGVGLVGVLHGWLERRKGRLTAWFCTVVLLATMGFLRVARVGELDVLLSLGCCVALIGLTKVDEGEGGWGLFWGGFAVAAMTKGAAAAVVPLTAVVFAVVQEWRLSKFGRAFWLGLWGFGVVVLPWHLAMWRTFGERFWAEYVGLHVMARATSQIEGHVSHWWYYGVVLVATAMPFVLLWPVAAVDLWRRRELRVWVVFAVVVLVFYSVVQTRLPHYVAPIYPAMAVVTAVWLGERLRPFVEARRPLGFWVKWAVVAAVVWGLSVAVTGRMRRELRETKLADGRLMPNNAEAIGLLKDVSGRTQGVEGPLLVWRDGPHRSIATDVFYSGRAVQIVELSPGGGERNRYSYDPRALSEAVLEGPRLILVDKSLLAQLPAGMLYQQIAAKDGVAVGRIWRVR